MMVLVHILHVCSASSVLVDCNVFRVFVVIILLNAKIVSLNDAGRNERGKGGTIARAQNHYGGAESLRKASKSPSNVISTSFNAIHLLP